MLKALIVDDDISVIQCIEKLIKWQELGYDCVHTAMNGEEAYDIIVRENTDAVITDLKMPVMGGMELVRKLRENNFNTEVILLTAYEDFSAAREGIELNFRDYLLKPLVIETIERLSENLRTIATRRKSAQWIDSLIRDEYDGKILEAFLSADEEYIDNIFESLRNCNFNVEGERLFHLASSKLIRILCDYLRGKAFSEDSIRYNCDKLLNQLKLCETFETRIDRLCEKTKGIIGVTAGFVTGGQNNMISEIKKYISQNYMKYDFGLGEVAEFFHYSKDHINRIFKTEEGITVSDYIFNYRMEKARSLILETNSSVVDIAKLVGYSSVSYFTSSYKKKFGSTPTAMREKNIYIKNYMSE